MSAVYFFGEEARIMYGLFGSVVPLPSSSTLVSDERLYQWCQEGRRRGTHTSILQEGKEGEWSNGRASVQWCPLEDVVQIAEWQEQEVGRLFMRRIIRIFGSDDRGLVVLLVPTVAIQIYADSWSLPTTLAALSVELKAGELPNHIDTFFRGEEKISRAAD